MGLGFFKIWNATATVKKEFDAKVTAGTMLKADTLDDLAAKMKVLRRRSKATVARYNELVKGGKDLDFGKRANRLTPIDKPPYYAGWTAKPATALVVLGGRLNKNCSPSMPPLRHPRALPVREHGRPPLQGRLSGDLPRTQP